MKLLKLYLFIIFVQAATIANAWKIKDNIITIEKGDNLSAISHVLFERGFDFSRLWEGRLDTVGNNPNLIYAGMRFKLFPLKKEDVKNDDCCEQNNIVNNNYTEKSKSTTWGDWWRDALLELLKIVLFPLLAALLPKIFFKKQYTPRRFSIVLSCAFGGVILWTVAKNITFSTNKTYSKSETRHSIDSINIKDVNLVLNQKGPYLNLSDTSSHNPDSIVSGNPKIPDSQWPIAISIIIFTLVAASLFVLKNIYDKRLKEKNTNIEKTTDAYHTIFNQFLSLRDELMGYISNMQNTQVSPVPIQQHPLTCVNDFSDTVDTYQFLLHKNNAYRDLRFAITNLKYIDTVVKNLNEIKITLEKMKTYILEIPQQ